METMRSKRPSDFNEALSSMLWTPYDNSASTSTSTDILASSVRQKSEHRYSNPLPTLIKWSNEHDSCSKSMRMKYSFLLDLNRHNFSTKKTLPKTRKERNFEHSFNTSMFEPAIVRSFTDDFYHYQNNKYECQSTNKNYKSQPLVQLDSCTFQSTSHKKIDKTFEDPAIDSTAITTVYYGDNSFNQQISGMRKAEGYMGDVPKGPGNRQNKPCTNTTVNSGEKSRKVTQPPNVIQSGSTLNSRNNRLRGNEFMNREENCTQTQTNAILKTLLGDMVAASSASRREDSNECGKINLSGSNRRGFDKHRLPQRIHRKSVDMDVTDLQDSLLQPSLQLQEKKESVHGVVFYDKITGDWDAMGNKKQVKSRRSNESGDEISPDLTNRDKIENVDDGSKHHIFSMNGSLNNGVDSVLRSCSTQIVHDIPATSENENVTSAARKLLSDEFVKSRIQHKAKYSDNFFLREKRRKRNRRDCRQARVRRFSANEILPGAINNHLPPPYAEVPVQVIVPSTNSIVAVANSQYSFSHPLVVSHRRSVSDRYGKNCCDQCFHGPPLRFLVALVALGGVACTLGGATLGSIALAGSPSSHLTAGLLMTGVGIVLVTISGVAWRMTTSDNPQCSRRRQCTRGNSSFGILYPEFQHRPPPPSYQNSTQQNRFREMMKNRERQAAITRVSPPPTYHSNAGSLLSPPTTFAESSFSATNAQSESFLDTLSTSTINSPAKKKDAFPQTIGTMTLMTRLNDNELDEFTLTMPDENSLIQKRSRINNTKDTRWESDKIDDNEICMNEIHRKNLNFIQTQSSSTYTSAKSNDRIAYRNTVSIMDHNNHAYVKNCENVYSTHGKELNKTLLPITRSSSSMTSSCADSFVNVGS